MTRSNNATERKAKSVAIAGGPCAMKPHKYFIPVGYNYAWPVVLNHDLRPFRNGQLHARPMRNEL